MRIKTLALLTTAALASVAWAQAPVATFNSVQGVVTVTSGNTASNAMTGGAIPNGGRVVTSASGQATFTTNSGCRVTMQPNQAVTVTAALTCAQIVAGVQGVTGAAIVATAPAGAVVGANPVVVNAAIGAGAAATVLYTFNQLLSND